VTTYAWADELVVPKFNFAQPAANPQEVGFTLQMLAVLVVLSVAPAILLMMTSFTRITVVLLFLKKAVGFGQLPNQILMSLALLLTLCVMGPVWNTIHSSAYEPYVHEQISQQEALNQAGNSIREFMLKQTREKDIALFVQFSKEKAPESLRDVPLSTLTAAFMLSELKTAFVFGFLIYIPFLIVDLVVSSVLVAMGMLVFPPMLISVPMKILLFVLVDGWYLVTRSLLGSF
jgi:flagellar biosynthetic protein FliP